MSDLVAMTAIAKGTIVGVNGIIHVDPKSVRENGRYSRPVVSESDAVQLEKRGLAVRGSAEAWLQDQGDALRGAEGDPVVLESVVIEPGSVPVAEPVMAPPAPAPAPAPAAEPAPAAAEPAGAVEAVSIDSGLGDNDPDAPPAPTPTPAAAPADAARPGKRPKR